MAEDITYLADLNYIVRYVEEIRLQITAGTIPSHKAKGMISNALEAIREAYCQILSEKEKKS